MKEYTIYIRSNEHPRTINTPKMGRCYYTRVSVMGRDALEAKVAELRNAGELITDICTKMGTRVWL